MQVQDILFKHKGTNKMTPSQKRRAIKILKPLIMEVKNETDEFRDIYKKNTYKRIKDGIVRLENVLKNIQTVNDMINSGHTPDEIDNFLIDVNTHMTEIQYLISGFDSK